MIGISAQVSLYPLGQEDLSPAIDEALRIFREYGLDVNPGSMSTLVSGGDETVFVALQAAFRRAAGQGRVVMVVTFSNACPGPETEVESQGNPCCLGRFRDRVKGISTARVMKMSKDRVEELKKQIADLRKRWPAHSVPAAMMEQLDDLEGELRVELNKRGGLGEAAGTQALLFRAIGHVENEFDEPAAPDDIRAVESRLIIDPSLIEGLQGLEPGQQIMVVFYFHRSEGFDLLQHPRGDPSRPWRGVFALRSPRRPNPVGVTIVDLISVEGNVLRVRGLDAINGTPVLDLKVV
jgi:tRNA-Thr(GGU) m(6)t(6)A37 methyltransferase TsaA